MLCGLRAPEAGRLQLGDAQLQRRRTGSTRAPRARLGLAHVPEDRQARALVMGFAAWESAVLGYEALPALQPPRLDAPRRDARGHRAT